MKTVWVVEKGEYSDYHVVGVFTSKENAEMVAEQCGGSIDEWPLDPAIENMRAGLSIYFVRMKKNGDTEAVHRHFASYLNADLLHTFQRPGRRCRDTILAGHVWARDEKHAVKIANEKRAQLIANNEWPEDPT